MQEETEAGHWSDPRRRFLRWLAGVISAAITVLAGVPLLGLLVAPALKPAKEQWVDLGPVASVPEDQPAAFTFSFQRTDGWLETTVHGTAYAVRHAAQGIYVLSNLCTHLGCPVRWDDALKQFRCPCHGGFFDIAGEVVSGPPPKALPRYRFRVAKGILQIRVEQG